MPLIIEFRVGRYLRRAVVRLQNFMLKFLDPTLPATEEHLVESECIRQMVLRYIGDARGQGHPTTAHAPQFYPIWRDFNAAYDRLRDRTRPQRKPRHSARVDAATLRRGAILAKYGPLDNNTEIIAFRTDFADPVDGQRDYYSEEELANCAWTARKLGHAPDARLHPNLTLTPTHLAPQPLAPQPPRSRLRSHRPRRRRRA